ncbi:MAG TPA: kelch repeat-containing protein [Candidatus Sulfotelmatobacter sp.]
MHRSLVVAVPFLAFAFGVGASNSHRATSSVPTGGSIRTDAPMLEARSGHTATLLPDGRVLIAGGMRRNQDFYRSAEVYDPQTGKFQRAGEMSIARVGHIAVLLRSGKVLVAGGWVGHGSTDSAELYDRTTGKFAVIGKMTARRGEPRATLLANGDVLITGGDGHDGPDGSLASAEIFHASSLSFAATGAMHYARTAHTATLLNNGQVLIAGGKGQTLAAVAELYDPATGKFHDTGTLAAARYKHTAGLLPDGRVLIAGGSDERDWSGNMSSAEIYNPSTGRFTPSAAMNDSRFKLPESAVQLLGGKLLIAGGSKQVEVFDPAAGRFIVASGELSDKWHFMTETKLRDGRVLLAGGYPNNDQATAQTWIYEP